MTREDVIRMAREAGLASTSSKPWSEADAARYFESSAALHRFAAFVAAGEREACAEIAEETAVLYGLDNPDDYDKGCMDCAKAIRARGK
jgi:hypothetical protein